MTEPGAIPQTIDALSASFLTVALESVADGAVVTAVSADDIGAGVGVFGTIARLRLTWDREPANGPTTLIAKFPTAAPANRAVGLVLGLYEREHRFYSEAADRVPVRVPRCYFTSGNATDGTYLLLLEDLAGLEGGDQLAGLGPRRAQMIIEQLAAMHAQWWDTPELDSITWLPVQNDPFYLAAVPPIVTAGVAALPPLASTLPEGSLELAKRVDASFIDLIHACAAGPRTFVHGDARLDNLFFALDTDDAVFIDWQLSLRCRGIYDVVWLLATSMDPEVQNTSAQALLGSYQTALASHGVKVSSHDLRRAAAEHAAYLLSGPLSLIGTFDFSEAGNGRAAALTKKWVARGFNLALLLGAADVLP